MSLPYLDVNLLANIPGAFASMTTTSSQCHEDDTWTDEDVEITDVVPSEETKGLQVRDGGQCGCSILSIFGRVTKDSLIVVTHVLTMIVCLRKEWFSRR